MAPDGVDSRQLGLPSIVLLGLLSVAGIACCIAVAIQQVRGLTRRSSARLHPFRDGGLYF